jgi:hypothetical protein
LFLKEGENVDSSEDILKRRLMEEITKVKGYRYHIQYRDAFKDMNIVQDAVDKAFGFPDALLGYIVSSADRGWRIRL